MVFVDRIISKIPELEPLILGKVSDDSIEDIVLHTFFQLACFFEDPSNNSFDLRNLYNNLHGDMLYFAKQLIGEFVAGDISGNLLMRDGNEYLDQRRFAEYLTENGLRYSEAKLSVYIKRGYIPKPNLVINGKRYWKRETGKKFLYDNLKE